MTGAGPLAHAAAELYAADLGEFTARRSELASRARAAGDQDTARQIAALRKPTRAAWLVNQLVRADPGVPGRLAGLGTDLRAAAAALDGARIRELSQARRRLVDDLVREALERPGQQAAGPAVREELTVTFGAAVADPEVARQLAAGTLVRAVQHGGLEGLELELESPPGAGTARRGERAGAQGARRERSQAGQARPRAQSQAGQARRRGQSQAGQAERDRRRQLAAAQRAVAAAERAAGAAARAERQRDEEVQRLEAQLTGLQARLAEARQQLAEARERSGDAQRAEQAARDAAHRLGG